MDRLNTALRERSAVVSIVGLGYIGLPLALSAANAGFKVVGLDSDPQRLDTLRKGQSPVKDITDTTLQITCESGQFSVTADTSTLNGSDVIVICVPTPLRDGTPDMSFIESAALELKNNLRDGQLVILESTTYPGTTEVLLKGILESTGLKAGSDFFLGFSPERIDPGNPTFQLNNVPKVIGGFDSRSADLMELFYKSFVSDVVRVSSARVAEMAKLLENTYRHVNIALANEMAILCHDLGIDVWEVIDAAATKPFGFQAFYPGPGWGGHCIPVDPAYLSWSVRQMGSTAEFVDLARAFNERMPVYVVQRIKEALEDRDKILEGSTVLVLGVAYKPDVNDGRESPAIEILQMLRATGAAARFHDPHVPTLRLKDETLTSCELTEETLAHADIVLLHTSHSVFDRQWLVSFSLGRRASEIR